MDDAGPSSEPNLIGRRAEARALAGFVDALAAGRSGTVVLQGRAGVGKSHVLRSAVAAPARDLGLTVVRCNGHAGDGELAYAGLADLFGGVDLEATPLPPPQKAALEVILRRRRRSRASDALTVSTATRTLLAGMAATRPVLVVVDDLQWLDAPTWQALLFAMQRLEASGSPVGLAAAWRVGDVDQAVLDELFGTLRATLWAIEPMDDADIMLIAAAVAPELHTDAVVDVTRRAAGFPLFAVELARHGAGTGRESLPATVEASFGLRLASLSEGATRVIGLCSLAATMTVEMLERCLGRDEAESALVELADADLAIRDGNIVQLRHPLVAAVVVGRLAESDNRNLRRLLVEHASTCTERAHHMRALTGAPDTATADELLAAADEHVARGALVEAARLAEAAADYTPVSHVDREDRVVGAARALIEVLLVDEAEALLERSGPLGEPRCQAWAEWTRGLAALIRMQAEDADRHFVRASELSDDPEVVERALVDRSYVLVQLARLEESMAAAEAAVEVARQLPGPLLSEALAANVASHAASGRPWSRAQLDEALDLEDLERRTQPYLRPTGVAAVVAIFEDDIRGAEACLMRLVAMGAASGPTGDHYWVELFLGYCRARLGTLSLPEGWSVEWDVFAWAGSSVGFVARVLSGAEELPPIGPLLAAIAQISLGTASVMLTALTALMIAEDRHAEFVEAVAPIFQGFVAIGGREPVIVIWATDLAEAYLALANPEAAAAIVSELEGLVAELPRRSVRAGLARVEALRLAQLGQLEAAAASVTSSIDLYAELEWPVELGRSLLVRAHISHRRRASRAALADATRAADLFAIAGSLPWSRKAEAAIERFSRRGAPRAGRTLTEERVAEHVRLGLSNAEIAARLHVSVKTVESHLTRIYRNAGVKSRGAFQALASAEDPI